MNLAWNRNAEFTKWVVSARLLTEPFVLIDVGVPGGKNVRWRALGDHLIVHGFDPIEEVVQNLIGEDRESSNRHYHYMAVGNADGEQALYFSSINPFESSMYERPSDRIDEKSAQQVRMVPARPVSINQLIKSIIIYELHALNDVALDVAEALRRAPRCPFGRRACRSNARRSRLSDERISTTSPRPNSRIRTIDQLADNRTTALAKRLIFGADANGRSQLTAEAFASCLVAFTRRGRCAPFGKTGGGGGAECS
jgi:hypothetical protein